MYLSAASKEEDGVQDVAGAVASRPGISPGHNPSPSIPQGSKIRGAEPGGWGQPATSVFRTGPLATVPSPPARPRRTAISTGGRLPPPGATPPSPDRAAAQGSRAPTMGGAEQGRPPQGLARGQPSEGEVRPAAAPVVAIPARGPPSIRRGRGLRAQIPAAPFPGARGLARGCLWGRRGRGGRGRGGGGARLGFCPPRSPGGGDARRAFFPNLLRSSHPN
jgi:hypothetical protein